MEYILICTIGYAIFLFADIIPSIKKKQWKALRFSIPIFLITFTLNVMIGLGVDLIRPNRIITNLVSAIFHLE